MTLVEEDKMPPGAACFWCGKTEDETTLEWTAHGTIPACVHGSPGCQRVNHPVQRDYAELTDERLNELEALADNEEEHCGILPVDGVLPAELHTLVRDARALRRLEEKSWR